MGELPHFETPSRIDTVLLAHPMAVTVILVCGH